MIKPPNALIFGFDSLNYTNNSIKNTGLFGYQGLTSALGISEAVKACISRATELVNTVCNANTDAEISKTVHRVDAISDVLCTVLDSAELIRNVHPRDDFVNAANDATFELHNFLNQLNTNQVLERPMISLKLSDQERKVANLLICDFEKSGIGMISKDRKRFIELNDSILETGQSFVKNAHPFQKSIKILNPRKAFSGCPSNLLDALCESSSKNEVEIPTNSEVASFLLKNTHSNSTRKALFLAMNSASDRQMDTLEKLLMNRGELARLLGYKSYSLMYLKDKMIESPENATNFLYSLVSANKVQVDQEFKSLKECKVNNGSLLKFEQWDRYYYAAYNERLCGKSSGKLLDSSPGLRNYFSVGNTLTGLSGIFSDLYGITLELQDVVPGEVWHKDVRKLAVVHESEGTIGYIYCDLFKRESADIWKYENAAHFTIRCCRRIHENEENMDAYDDKMRNMKHERKIISDGVVKRYQIPIVVLVTSFARPDSPNEIPTLLDLSEVETLFHEMGHAMHSMLAQTDFQHISGTRVVMDFVEVPSILLECFAKVPKILASFGVHYKTGERVSQSLIESRVTRQANSQALETQNQLQMALIDLQYHSETALEPNFDSSQIAYDISRRVHPIPFEAPTRWHAQFSHLFTYGSSYYSYLWSRRLATQIFKLHFANKSREEWRESGHLFRHEVLAYGNGRDPWIGLKKMGVCASLTKSCGVSALADLELSNQSNIF